MVNELETLLTAYGIDSSSSLIEVISSGLINPTWKITSDQDQFILQRINTSIFREPAKLAENTRRLSDYVSKKFPEYLFVAPIPANDGNELVKHNDQVYRLYPFVKNSHTIQSVSTVDQAYEAAVQFGKFTSVFSGFDPSQLHSTIPDFHNLTFRHQQFRAAVRNGNQQRVAACSKEIQEIESCSYLVDQYYSILKSRSFKLRVTHHDTKISNVLFDPNDKGICVIDLDTVMPGYFISDVGDMMRTYLSPSNEEETDFSKIIVRADFYKAIAQGYLENMKTELSKDEMKMFYFSGLMMTYMQAIRFLGDYLTDDNYYLTHHEAHNLVRAQNQLYLFSRLLKEQASLSKIISGHV